MQASSITVNDGSATPVAITFTPEEVSPSRTVYVDRRKTARSLQPSIIVGYSPASAARKTAKPTFGVVYPIEGIVNGVAAPVDVARFENGKFTIPENMSLQDRKHLFAFVTNGMQVTQIKAVCVDLEPLY